MKQTRCSICDELLPGSGIDTPRTLANPRSVAVTITQETPTQKRVFQGRACQNCFRHVLARLFNIKGVA